MFLGREPLNVVSILIREENRQETLQFIEDKWRSFGALNPFDYQFLDVQMDDMYVNEGSISKVFRIASLISIFVALLGLLGLSSLLSLHLLLLHLLRGGD